MLRWVEVKPNTRFIGGLIILVAMVGFLSGVVSVVVRFRVQGLGVRVQGLGVSGVYAGEKRSQAISESSYSSQTARKWHIVDTTSKEVSPKSEIVSEPLIPIHQPPTPQGKSKSPSDIIFDPGPGGSYVVIEGQLKITGGGPSANKVLTSDTAGLASWQDLESVPTGVIAMYSGPWNFITSGDTAGLGTGPLEGWALCNGNNGTPNLSDRFVLCTTSSSDTGETGGSHSYTLTVNNLPPHTHTFSATTDEAGEHSHSYGFANMKSYVGKGSDYYAYTGARSTQTGTSGSHSHTFSGVTGSTGAGEPFDNRPKYIKLAFIMKL